MSAYNGDMLRTLTALLCGGILLVAFAPGGAFWPEPAFAQVNFGGASALIISAAPAHPTPNSTVELTAESPLLDLADSDIEWSVNGKSAGSGETIRVQLGPLGQETDVSVSVSGTSGSDSAQISLVPSSIDLLWEADSYVPPFYLGRALPGSGSMIRLFAIPHMVQAGSEIAPSGLQYTWKLNGATLKAQSGIGESSIVVPAAILYGSDTIIVDVVAPSNGLSAEASISIRTGDPYLALYDDSPLFGIMYHQSLSGESNADESETSFAAVPYFAEVSTPNDQSLAYAWTVNGSSVNADPKDPSEITIDAQSQGVAQIGLSLSNPSDPFFSAQGSWQVAFSANAADGGTSVFH